MHADHYKIRRPLCGARTACGKCGRVFMQLMHPRVQKSRKTTFPWRARIESGSELIQPLNVLEFWSKFCSVGFDPIQKSHSLFRSRRCIKRYFKIFSEFRPKVLRNQEVAVSNGCYPETIRLPACTSLALPRKPCANSWERLPVSIRECRCGLIAPPWGSPRRISRR